MPSNKGLSIAHLVCSCIGNWTAADFHLQIIVIDLLLLLYHQLALHGPGSLPSA